MTIINIVAFLVLIKRDFVIKGKNFIWASLLMFGFMFFVLSGAIYVLRDIRPESVFFLVLFVCSVLINVLMLASKMVDKNKVYDFIYGDAKKGWVYGIIRIPDNSFCLWLLDVKIPEKEYVQKQGLRTRIKVKTLEVFSGCFIAEIV